MFPLCKICAEDNSQTLYEAWHYPKSTEDLFRAYMMAKIKTKQEAWPSHVVREAERVAYVERYEKETGIRLNPEAVAKNSDKRQHANSRR